MTVLVDRRTGSVDLHGLLPRGGSEIVDLPYADAMFLGSGPDPAQPIAVGVERKRLSDALQCMDDGRYAGAGGQLEGLISSYDVVWLVIEDTFRAHPTTGVLQRWALRYPKQRHHAKTNPYRWKQATFGNSSRPLMYRDFRHWLASVSYIAALTTGKPVMYTSTGSAKETADWIWCEYTWWQKPWNSHKSCKTFNRSHQRLPAGMKVTPNGTAFHVKELDGVGWEYALPISDSFESIRDAYNGTVDDYRAIRWIDAKNKMRRLPESLCVSIVEQVTRKRKVIRRQPR